MIKPTSDYLYERPREIEKRGANLFSVKKSPTTLQKLTPHFHDVYEMILYETIDATVLLNNKEHPIKTGMILFLPPYTLHHFELKPGEARYHVSHFTKTSLEKIEWSIDTPFLFAVSKSVLEQMITFFSIEPPPSSGIEEKKSFYQEKIAFLLTWVRSLLPESSAISLPHPGQKLIPLLKYLDENNVLDLSIDDAANFSGVSRSGFTSIFRKYYGTSFSRFLIERKIAKAKLLLLTGPMGVTEIAHRLNFYDTSFFIKTFKKELGMTPLDFRERNRL